MGSVDDAKLKKIVKMTQFKDILQENLVEFNLFYTKQVEKRASKFTDDAITEYYNKISLEGFTVKNMNKSDQQLAYEIVEQLNTEIFNKTMNQIKQMMTIAIMETQALLDKIDVNTKTLRFRADESFMQ